MPERLLKVKEDTTFAGVLNLINKFRRDEILQKDDEITVVLDKETPANFVQVETVYRDASGAVDTTRESYTITQEDEV
jgi:hypothetical protein